MARANKRLTAWVGRPLNEESLGSTNGADGDETLITWETLTEHSPEPTLVRTFGRFVVGSTPSSGSTTSVVHVWWALVIAPIDTLIPLDSNDGQGDERILCSGFLRSVWANEDQATFTSAAAVTWVPRIRNQQGPWEMSDFESSAMRRIREQDTLRLVYTLGIPEGAVSSVKVSGYVRCLLKL